MNEQEKMFLALRKNFWIQNKVFKQKEVLMDVEDILYDEKKEEVERDKIRRKVIPIVERTNKNRGDNLTKKERRGTWEINRRNGIVIQAVHNGGTIAKMEKEWYKERKKQRGT